MTRAARMAASALVAVLLASCASIPTSGPVLTSDRQGGAQENQNQSIRVLARPPAPDATPEQIVTGFLRASSTSENDFAVAREYLGEPAAGTWDPGAGVQVYNSAAASSVERRASTAAVFTASFVGRIGPYGEFTSVQDRRLRAEFAFTRASGQWRLAEVPEGLVLSTLDVQRTFRVADIYFPAIDRQVLVPDAVYAPIQRPLVRSRLVETVVNGPTSWLAPAVRTAFPAGTRAVGVGRPDDTGVIDVELSREALDAGDDDRLLMLAQLTLTLTGQLSEVSGVRVEVDGTALAVSGIGPVVRRADVAALEPSAALIDSSAYAISEGNLHILGDDEPQRAVTGFFGNGPDLVTAAVSLDGAWRAGVTADGQGPLLSRAPTADPAAEIIFRGDEIGPLSFDRDRALWFVNSPDDGRDELYVAREETDPVRVRVVGLGARRIVSMRMSLDGARVALAAETDDGPSELLVGRVVRTGAVPVVEGLRRLEQNFVEVRDVAWSTSSSLLVVARDEISALQVYAVGVDGGSVLPAGTVPGLLEVAAAPNRVRLAGAEDSVIWTDLGTGWRQRARGDHPFYPG